MGQPQPQPDSLCFLLPQKNGTEPAFGSSVMITALIDSGDFFLFLRLAPLFLTSATSSPAVPLISVQHSR